MDHMRVRGFPFEHWIAFQVCELTSMVIASARYNRGPPTTDGRFSLANGGPLSAVSRRRI
jgi:hypothetical protein